MQPDKPQNPLEVAMEIVTLFEPITGYQITPMQNESGHQGALIDIHRQCEPTVNCYLEPQTVMPLPAILAKQILHACGWVNVEIGDDGHG